VGRKFNADAACPIVVFFAKLSFFQKKAKGSIVRVKNMFFYLRPYVKITPQWAE